MKKQSDHGFTLVEVVTSAVLLLIGIAIISSVISGVVRRNFFSHRNTQAVILAQNKIEELMSDGYMSSNLAEGGYENQLNPVDATGDSSGIFFQTWKIQDLYPIERSKMITSTVRWVPTGAENDTTGTVEMNEVTLTAVCIDPSN